MFIGRTLLTTLSNDRQDRPELKLPADYLLTLSSEHDQDMEILLAINRYLSALQHQGNRGRLKGETKDNLGTVRILRS